MIRWGWKSMLDWIFKGSLTLCPICWICGMVPDILQATSMSWRIFIGVGQNCNGEWISHHQLMNQPLMWTTLGPALDHTQPFFFSEPSRSISSIFRKRHKSSVTPHDWRVMANLSCNNRWKFLPALFCCLLSSLKSFLCKVVSHFLGLAGSHCSHTHDLLSGSFKIRFI